MWGIDLIFSRLLKGLLGRWGRGGIKPTYRWREGEVAAWTEGARVISSRISTKLTTDISALAAG